MAILIYKNYTDFIINMLNYNINNNISYRNSINVNIYLFDALSRYRFSKQMIYTVSYIKKIRKKYRIYEMMKYHTLGVNSPLNYRALIQGNNTETLFKFFSENNYTTIAIPGYYDPNLYLCGRSNRNYVNYNIQLFKNCSNNYLYGKNKRCLGNKHRHKHQLDVLEFLYSSYSETSSLFSFTSFMESHDPSFVSLTRVDKDFSNHLQNLENANILNNSITILIGDHGFHYGRYYHTEVFFYI